MPQADAKLLCASLTGADDGVPVRTLRDISSTHPFVEWAILYYPEREGSPRNPTPAWREQFLSDVPGRTAAHLCGEQVFEELLSPQLAKARIDDLRRFGRVQLNINARKQVFEDPKVLKVYQTLLEEGLTLIVQYHENSKSLIEQFVASCGQEELSRIHVLFDNSRGKGMRPEGWLGPLRVANRVLVCGYAGGLGPDVMEQELPRIRQAAAEAPYWVDMESGLRTNNAFDVPKAVKVLDTVARSR
jgi:hypothetical protein